MHCYDYLFIQISELILFTFIKLYINSSEGAPRIEWELDDLPIRISGSRSKYDIVDYNRKLVIKNVTESDEYNYTCVGTNPTGETRVYVELDVICK